MLSLVRFMSATERAAQKYFGTVASINYPVKAHNETPCRNMSRPAPRRKTKSADARGPARKGTALGSFAIEHPDLIKFSAAYLMVAAVGTFVTRNTEFAFYLITLVVIISIVVALHLRIGFSLGVLWCLSVWGALHLAGGLMPLPDGWPYAGDQAVWYSGWIIPSVIKYDNVVHAFGFGTTAVAALQAMSPSVKQGIAPTLGQAIAASLVGCGLGSVNEILEFIATRISPTTNVGGYVNTSLDLVSNLIGTFIAMILVSLTAKRR
jgi:uncharacterized membrane protein